MLTNIKKKKKKKKNLKNFKLTKNGLEIWWNKVA